MNRKMHWVISLLFIQLLVYYPEMGKGAIINVPGGYATIQDAINNAVNGDMVIVNPGTYYERIIMNGKNIILCSKFFLTGDTSYITSTIIDGESWGRVITVNSGEDSTCMISGFTIRNGNTWQDLNPMGGGVLIENSSARIFNCVIRNNEAPENGGGLAVFGASAAPLIRGCRIINNTAGSFGGGIFIGDCSTRAEIVGCIVSGNSVTCSCGYNGSGGGISIYHTGKVTNCLISGNTAINASIGGGGIFCDWGTYYGNQQILVTGCTITENSASGSGGVGYVIDGGDFRNCIIWNNTNTSGSISNYTGNNFFNCCTVPLPAGPGNIDSDPWFINPAAKNYRLSSLSPCINSGDNAFNSQSFDLDGNQRIAGSNIDMGAYEDQAGVDSTIQIGSGPLLTGSLPIYSVFQYNYSQQLYLSGEINAANNWIRKIRFQYQGGASFYSAWNNWTLYLGNTNKAEFNTTSDWIPKDSLTMVFSGVIPDPVAGNWVEIILTKPFFYDGRNLVVAVDENSTDWDCCATWSAFYNGDNRAISYYSYDINPDPESPPMATSLESLIPQLQFDISHNIGILQGHITEEPFCTDPVSGVTVVAGSHSTITDSSGYYRLEIPAGIYPCLTAYYMNVTNTVQNVTVRVDTVATQDFCLPAYFPPPVSLQATTTGTNLNTVHLTWKQPGAVPDQWIHWDNGDFIGAMGYLGPATFSVASRWPVEDIAPFNGTYLKKIRFSVSDPLSVYTIKIWTGENASTLVLSQPVIDPYIGGWNEITLSTPVLIDGTRELWFGYEAVQYETGYPVTISSGPSVAGKGDMMNSGYGWFSVHNSWGWEWNWPLQGFISDNPSPSSPQILLPAATPASHETNFIGQTTPPDIPSVKLFEHAIAAGNNIGNASPAKMNNNVPANNMFSSSKVLTGYNIYRDNVLIADSVTDLFYNDPELPAGIYQYGVTALYTTGESQPAGPVQVQVYNCFPPTGLTVSNDSLTTTTARVSWTPSTLSPELHWILEYGYSGFQQGTGITVDISDNPYYTIGNLSPGYEYDVYVKTYCESAGACEWVMKKFKTHYFNCPSGSVPEREICGENTNGCDPLFPQYDTILNGETICGTAWLLRSHRDADWYAFTINQPSDVKLTGNAEFTSRMGIGLSPCPTGQLYNYSTAYGPGFNRTFSIRLLNPGTYFVYVMPDFSEQVACDSINRYWIHLSANSCLTPDSLKVFNTTPSTADLEWYSTSGQWNIEYGPYGFTQGTGTMINGTTSNPYHLTGLTMGRYYSFYVQSNCGTSSVSEWAGPCTFYIPCPSSTLPFSESFTAQTIGITPQCWNIQGNINPGSWTTEMGSMAGGEVPELSFNPYNNFFSGQSSLWSPVINTTGMASVIMSFKQYLSFVSYTLNASVRVLTTSDGGVNWQEVWSFSQPGYSGASTVSFEISNSDIGSASFQVAFSVSGNSWEIPSWKIDDISLIGIPKTGTLEGLITTCGGTQPLAGVSVTAGSYNTATNASGAYQIPDMLVGSYSVVLSKSGYVTKTIPAVQIQYNQTTTLDTCLALSGPPVNRTIANDTVKTGQTRCYDATQVITVAGAGTSFVVQSGSTVNMIAGSKIDFRTGTKIKSGSHLHGWIAPTGPYCGAKEASFIETADYQQEPAGNQKSGIPVVFPNPTSGIFYLNPQNVKPENPVRMCIYNLQGNRILEEEFVLNGKHEFNLSGKPAGIYVMKLFYDDSVYTIKVILNR